MRRVVFLLIVASLCAGAAARRKSAKPPDVQVVETRARRDGPNITLDGKVRNTGEKPIRGLVLIFHFLSPEKAVITTQKTQIEEAVLELGKEAVFHALLVDPVRAVHYRYDAEDQSGKELRVANPGPYIIE